MPNLLKRSRKRAEAKATSAFCRSDEAGPGPADANDAPALSETAQGAAEPFAELASWTAAELIQWIGDRHDNGAALAALDEACQALPDDVRPEVEKRITEAYTWLARNTLADIAESQCARSAGKDEPAAAENVDDFDTLWNAPAEPAAVEAGEPGADEDLAAWRARLTEMGLPVDGLHTWDAHRIQNWIFNHPSVEALRALDELADTLTGVRRAKILKEIATAYARLAQIGRPGITIEVAQQRRKLADELWDRVERTFAERGYTMEEAEQAEAAAAEAEPAAAEAKDEEATDSDQSTVTMLPTSTGAVIAYVQGVLNGVEVNRYVMQVGAYVLHIDVPDDEKAWQQLIGTLLLPVLVRLEAFCNGEFPHKNTTAAALAVKAALTLLNYGLPEDVDPYCDTLDLPGPGGASCEYRLSEVGVVQFQRGGRGEAGSIAGVYDGDLLLVCQHMLETVSYGRHQDIAAECIEEARLQLAERMAERVVRGVLGKHVA